MNFGTRGARGTHHVWAMRAIAVMSALGITLAILRQAGVISRGQRAQLQAANPRPATASPIALTAEETAITPVVPKGNDSSISPKSLELLLVRTKPGRTSHEGAAQIGVVRESPQTYAAGALLENGARLVEIYSDYVVLWKDGRTARLYLSGRPFFGGSGDATLLVVGGADKPMTPARITSREALTDYVRPSPVYDGDSLVGYQVYSGAKAGPFAQLGLQPGDLIATLGGTPLNEVNTAWAVFRTLMDGAVLEAVVKRHGETVDMTLDGSILTRAEEARVANTGLPMMTSMLHGSPGP